MCKTLYRSSIESYGGQAVGYISLKRDGAVCTLHCPVCPEHRVIAKNYRVILTINEDDDIIMSINCEDCAGSNGNNLNQS